MNWWWIDVRIIHKNLKIRSFYKSFSQYRCACLKKKYIYLSQYQNWILVNPNTNSVTHFNINLFKLCTRMCWDNLYQFGARLGTIVFSHKPTLFDRRHPYYCSNYFFVTIYAYNVYFLRIAWQYFKCVSYWYELLVWIK